MSTITSIERNRADACSSEPWSADDSAQAMGDGWDIFATNRDPGSEEALVQGKPYGHRPFELQRIDEMHRFRNDDEAHAHVFNQAQLGNPLAAKVLRFLALNSPPEYAAIGHQDALQEGVAS